MTETATSKEKRSLSGVRQSSLIFPWWPFTRWPMPQRVVNPDAVCFNKVRRSSGRDCRWFRGERQKQSTVSNRKWLLNKSGSNVGFTASSQAPTHTVAASPWYQLSYWMQIQDMIRLLTCYVSNSLSRVQSYFSRNCFCHHYWSWFCCSRC